MWIERVVARAFGPFRDQALELAPGMTVVAGPNESGKSSWHAAIRLAITGVRRGKGPGTAAERQLAERHRPWDRDDRWEVEARLRLRDGRTVDISQDLAGKVACRAVDVALGRDVSDEIMDGTPDASRWLGLNRDTFAATVSVSQSQILAVTDAADDLQQQMQRAAATHGTDATAAEALDRLGQFRRDAVGVDRVGAKGPLRTAKERLAALEGRHAEAQRLHDAYLERAEALDAAEVRVTAGRAEVLRHEAALARRRADELAKRAERAAVLASRQPGPPEPLEARDERADEVAGAVDGWSSRPRPMVLDGRTAAQIEADIASLPAVPAGDLEPHPSAVEARRALDLSDAAVAALGEDPQPGPSLPAIEPSMVRDLARRLRQPQMPHAAPLEAELAAAERSVAQASRPSMLPIVVAAGLAVGAAASLLIAALPLVALLLVGLALVSAGVAWRLGGSGRRARERLARAQAAVAPFHHATALADGDRQSARSEARAAGLPEDPVALDELADRLTAEVSRVQATEDRRHRRAALERRHAAAAAALAHALADRGLEPVPDANPRAAFAAYEVACRQRAEQAAAASRLDGLTRELEARRAAERSHAAAVEAVERVERRLREAAASLRIDQSADPDLLVEQLRAWQERRSERLQANQAAIAEWQELHGLLEGSSLAELQSATARAADQARALAAQVAGGELPEGTVPQLEALLVDLGRELAGRTSLRDELAGDLHARRDGVPSVAEAEEAVVAAQAELSRVQRLAVTLDRTADLLRSAEERVHRDLAPVLAQAIGRWLPIVCGGAYDDVGVDPADLAVRVKESGSGSWRQARLLSEGTREQIYLLLRVAMAEHLVTTDEVAPLLLDEVTVQSDAERKRQLLGVLHRLSAERQVVLFTHDDDVIAWARESLSDTTDALVTLSPPMRAVGPGADAQAPPSVPVAVAD